MDVLGYHIPQLALNGTLSVVAAVVVVTVKALVERRLRARRSQAPVESVPEFATAVAAPPAIDTLAHERAAALDALYRLALSCEQSIKEISVPHSDEVTDACGAFLAQLRRRRLWMSAGLADRADEFTSACTDLIAALERAEREGGVDTKAQERLRAQLEALASGIAALRRRLEAEFRASSGLFSTAH